MSSRSINIVAAFVLGLCLIGVLLRKGEQVNSASTEGYFHMLCATFNADALERIVLEGRESEVSMADARIWIVDFKRSDGIQHCATLKLRPPGVVEYLLWPQFNMRNLEIHYRPQSHTPKYTPPIANTPIPLTDGAYRFRVEADVVRTVPTVRISKVRPSSL